MRAIAVAGCGSGSGTRSSVLKIPAQLFDGPMKPAVRCTCMPGTNTSVLSSVRSHTSHFSFAIREAW
jgi:hypothetical protein